MDFFKSVLPPLPKLPKLKKIRQWNGGSLLSLNQFPNLPAAFNLGGGSVPPPPAPPPQPVPRMQYDPKRTRQHMRHSSDISIISAAVSSRTPADYSRRDNLGLYALKCDRSAAKRGILLNLPRKITQMSSGVPPAAAPMVHEKFSPCKRHPEVEAAAPAIKPPPRRRKRPPRTNGQGAHLPPSEDLGRWQKNSSELFRIVERESASAARARSAGGVGLGIMAKKPHRIQPTAPKGAISFRDADTAVRLTEQVKAQSVDNLLAMRYHRRRRGAFAEPERQQREESDSESDRQVQSLRLDDHVTTPAVINATDQSKQIQPPSGASSLPATSAAAEVAIHHPLLDRACDFSIENNSDEIEVRFRKGYSTDESSGETVTPVAGQRDIAPERLPLPPRVVQLRRHDPVPVRAKKDPGVGAGPGVALQEFTPLAEVLRKSIDSGELKRKWINDFLSQGSVEPNDAPFVPQLDIVQRMDRQLEELEGGGGVKLAANGRQTSNGSVDIFKRTACDFDEFDALFTGASKSVEVVAEQPAVDAAARKSVKLSEQITYIAERASTTSNLCFSSSSFSCTSMEDGKPVPPPLPTSLPPMPAPPPPPPPPPLPPAAGGQKSGEVIKPIALKRPVQRTVQIQDYSSKHLQRVRYLSSPSPSRSSLMDPCGRRPVGSSSETDPNDNDENGARNSQPAANNNIVLPLNVFNIASRNDGEDGGSSTNMHQIMLNSVVRAPTAAPSSPHPIDQETRLPETARNFCPLSERQTRQPLGHASVIPDYNEYYNEEGVFII